MLLFSIAFGAQQEWLERKFPSPPEWSWVTRKNYRSARWNEDHGDGSLDSASSGPVDWARTGGAYRDLIKRLEDPNGDGKGLREQDEGGILVDGVGKMGYDIEAKAEPWKRGYYEVLMGAARAAEHLDGWVRDRTRNKAFPVEVVIGPSNPNPRPVPPGALSAPREEDCEPAFEAPETYYLRVLTTKGFTEKQRMDAALGYAAWLDYKGTPESAGDVYKWALDIAASSAPNPEAIFDKKTGTINPQAGPVSSNILTATTALAVHHARNNNLSTALPIFISILRARRSLTTAPSSTLPTTEIDSETAPTTPASGSLFSNISTFLTNTLSPPKYPPPPPSGSSPPYPNAQSRCEEAALMTYIGEIIYASSPSPSSSLSASTSHASTSQRQDALAWTREAVDLSETELRKGASGEALKTCRQCLETGLGNWRVMVRRLAKEEKEGKKEVGSGWWGAKTRVEDGQIGRWEAEEKVVAERIRRAGDVLGEEDGGRGESSGVFFV